MEIAQIEEDLRMRQGAKRFRHTMGVMYTSAALAMRYNGDMEKALLAGLLHDCAKQEKPEKLLNICRKAGLPVSEVEERNPFLLHGKAGTVYAEKRYGIEDKDILSAIAWHTTGKPDMTLLEKIVFTADYIEPSRDHAPNLSELRNLAFCDLDEAIVQILQQTLEYLQTSGGEIDPATERTLAFYSISSGWQDGIS